MFNVEGLKGCCNFVFSVSVSSKDSNQGLRLVTVAARS